MQKNTKRGKKIKNIHLTVVIMYNNIGTIVAHCVTDVCGSSDMFILFESKRPFTLQLQTDNTMK